MPLNLVHVLMTESAFFSRAASDAEDVGVLIVNGGMDYTSMLVQMDEIFLNRLRG